MAEIQPLTLRYSARARAQLIAICDYIHERNPTAAARVGAAIGEAADMIRYVPDAAGRPLARNEGMGRAWIAYIIVYEVMTDVNEVVILSIFHGARRRE